MVEFDGKIADAQSAERLCDNGKNFGVGEQGVVGSGDVKVLAREKGS